MTLTLARGVFLLKTYALNVLIAIDQLANALIGGYPDESLSASAYLGEQEGKILAIISRPCIDGLFYFIEKNHCEYAYLAEVNGSQLPRAYRKVTS